MAVESDHVQPVDAVADTDEQQSRVGARFAGEAFALSNHSVHTI